MNSSKKNKFIDRKSVNLINGKQLNVRIWNPKDEKVHKGTIMRRYYVDTCFPGGTLSDNIRFADSFMKISTVSRKCRGSSPSELIHNEHAVESKIREYIMNMPEEDVHWALKIREFQGHVQIGNTYGLLFKNFKKSLGADEFGTLENIIQVKHPSKKKGEKVFPYEVSAQNNNLTITDALQISLDVSDQLKQYHEMGINKKGIINFDLNPGNIIVLGNDKDKSGVKRGLVNDFGIARKSGAPLKELYNKSTASETKTIYYGAGNEPLHNILFSPPKLSTSYTYAEPSIDLYNVANLLSLMLTNKLVESYYHRQNVDLGYNSENKNLKKTDLVDCIISKGEVDEERSSTIKDIELVIKEELSNNIKNRIESEHNKEYLLESHSGEKLSDKLAELIIKGTNLNVNNRYNSAQDLIADLDKLSEDFNFNLTHDPFELKNKKEEFKILKDAELNIKKSLNGLGRLVPSSYDSVLKSNPEEIVSLSDFGSGIHVTELNKDPKDLLFPNLSSDPKKTNPSKKAEIIQNNVPQLGHYNPNQKYFSLNEFKQRAGIFGLSVIGTLVFGSGLVGTYSVTKHVKQNYVSSSSIVGEDSGTNSVDDELIIPDELQFVCGSQYVKEDFDEPINWSEFECRYISDENVSTMVSTICLSLDQYSDLSLVEENNLIVCGEGEYCCPPKKKDKSSTVENNHLGGYIGGGNETKNVSSEIGSRKGATIVNLNLDGDGNLKKSLYHFEGNIVCNDNSILSEDGYCWLGPEDLVDEWDKCNFNYVNFSKEKLSIKRDLPLLPGNKLYLSGINVMSRQGDNPQFKLSCSHEGGSSTSGWVSINFIDDSKIDVVKGNNYDRYFVNHPARNSGELGFSEQEFSYSGSSKKKINPSHPTLISDDNEHLSNEVERTTIEQEINLSEQEMDKVIPKTSKNYPPYVILGDIEERLPESNYDYLNPQRKDPENFFDTNVERYRKSNMIHNSGLSQSRKQELLTDLDYVSSFELSCRKLNENIDQCYVQSISGIKNSERNSCNLMFSTNSFTNIIFESGKRYAFNLNLENLDSQFKSKDIFLFAACYNEEDGGYIGSSNLSRI